MWKEYEKSIAYYVSHGVLKGGVIPRRALLKAAREYTQLFKTLSNIFFSVDMRYMVKVLRSGENGITSEYRIIEKGAEVHS